MRIETYHCPQCAKRLVRVARWGGYACEHCRIAVTLVNEQSVRVMRASGVDPQLVPIAQLKIIA